MNKLGAVCTLFLVPFIFSCSNDSDSTTHAKQDITTIENSVSNNDTSVKPQQEPVATSQEDVNTVPAHTDEISKNTNDKIINYDRLHKKIAYGKATFAEVRQALTDTNTSALTNTVHALYSMRQHRGVFNLLFDMWNMNKSKYPELAWEQISKAPVKIALASTINRILIVGTGEYKDYIRSFKEDEHEFHLAQVVISLGFNGSPDDIQYIKDRANGDNHYVAQSAITALAIMGGNFAKDAMIEVYNTHKGTPRGELVETLLKKAYDWTPTEIVAKNEEESESVSSGNKSN